MGNILNICNMYDFCIAWFLKDGDTALHYAASNGQLEPIHMLLKNFADINLQSNVSLKVFA